MAQMPTTQNSMTHYALTESQGDILEGDPEDVGDALRQALRETGAEEVKSRLQAAIDAGLLVNNALPTPEEPPPDGGDTHSWVITDGYDPPKYWQDGSQEWVDTIEGATHYNDEGKDAETLPSDPPTAAWMQV